MYRFVKPLLFLLPPEKAHHVTTSALHLLLKLPFGKAIMRRAYCHEHPALEKTLMGLSFKNPVGLAAGFDKNATLIDDFSYLGFGFIEVGTLTPKAQPGNAQPRLFRLKKDNALINRMGFNNDGVEKAIARLKKRQSGILVGGNIGKNKVTPNEEATQDYQTCFEALFPYVDYFVVNVSSPNTPGLRELQEKEPLKKLLSTLQSKNATQSKPKPILLKIAPDLSDTEIDDIIEITDTLSLDGLILTNTTIDRSHLLTPESTLKQIGNGGLSGKPLQKKSTHVIQYVRKKLPKTPIIAVGGIMSADDALEKIKAGADLLQIYTGLVYEGPGLIKKINQAIINHA